MDTTPAFFKRCTRFFIAWWDRFLFAVGEWTRSHYIRGMGRILRILHSPERRERHSISAVIPYGADLRIGIDTSSFIEWEIFFKGAYEPHVVGHIQELLSSGDVAVDVGANIGAHTLIMAACVGKSGRVIAVEPNPFVCKRLVDNLALNRFHQVTVCREALSEEAGSAVLHVFREGLSRQGMGGFYTSIVDDDRVDLPVRVMTLDMLVSRHGIHRMALVKIDTEGNDLKVILGGAKSIARFRPAIIFEYTQGLQRGMDFERAWERTQYLFASLDYCLLAYTPSGLKALATVAPQTSDNILACPRDIAAAHHFG